MGEHVCSAARIMRLKSECVSFLLLPIKHKLSGLKQHAFTTFTVSIRLKSRQGLTVPSVQGLTRLKSRCQLDCVPFLSSGSSSKLAGLISRRLMTELLNSLLAVGQGPLLATEAMLSCLSHDASISFQDMTAGFFKARKRISCFDFLSPGKARALSHRAHLIRSGHPRKISL